MDGAELCTWQCGVDPEFSTKSYLKSNTDLPRWEGTIFLWGPTSGQVIAQISNLLNYFLWGMLQAKTNTSLHSSIKFEDVHRACDTQNQKHASYDSCKTVLFSCRGSNCPRGRPCWVMNVCMLIHIKFKLYQRATITLVNITCVISKNHFNLPARPCIWPIDGTLTCPTTPGQSGSKSNGNEVVHHILQIYRLGASPLDAV